MKMPLKKPYRSATAGDAKPMAELVDMAAYGLARHLWQQDAAPGQSAWEVGYERARRGAGGFSWHNTILRVEHGEVVACLIGYPLTDASEIDDDVPGVVVPLLELEALVPGSWYINVLATYPEYRGKGYGEAFLKLAEDIARAESCAMVSLIVSDSNTGGRRLYERHGFVEKASRPIIREDWQYDGKNWLLLVKDVGAGESG